MSKKPEERESWWPSLYQKLSGIATEIIEDLEEALEEFRAVEEALKQP